MTRVMFSWVAELCAAIVISTFSSLELHAQSFVYTNNESVPNTVSAFSIAANGSLAPVPDSPFPTGGDGTPSAGDAPVTAGNYLYVANNASGSISGFSINPTTGVLTSVPGSPFSTAESGNTLTATPDGKYLIAIGGSLNGTVYSIGANGVLTSVAGSPYVLGGSAGKITPDGKFLLVIHFGAVAVFSISPAGILSEVPGSPFILIPNTQPAAHFTGAIDVDCSGRFGYFSSRRGLASPFKRIDVIAIAADGSLAITTGGINLAQYVSDNDLLLSPDDKTLFASLTDFSFAAEGGVRSFNVAADGSLSFAANYRPVDPGRFGKMATDRTGSFLYVAGTSSLAEVIHGFSIASGGTLTPLPGSPFPNSNFERFSLTVFPAKVCPQIVNDKVSFVVQSTSLNSTPAPSAPAGVYSIIALLTNTSQQDIDIPINAVVKTITNGNLLLSATEGDGGTGSKQAIDAGADNKLSPNESVTVGFDIGLVNRNPFSFFVDVYGIQ
jgi:6-phosphogluconolactonase (cycloisomerase 2 family)